MATARQSATSRPTVWPGDDLPAWLSPMLVKELRQGLQSGAFTTTFMAIQGGLVLLMTIWIATTSDDAVTPGAAQFFRGCFWFLFALAAAVAIPLRGTMALRSEQVGQTFDLLRLTRLSTTQIVVGKWIAIMAQVLLIAIAVLPYVVLQYFLGGYAVVDDLATVAAVVVIAGMVTAVALLASTQAPQVRGVIVAVLVFFAMWGVVPALFVSGFGGGGFGALDGSGLALLALVTIPVSVVLLEYATARIAPRSENHALRKRALGLILVALALAATGVGVALKYAAWSPSSGQVQMALAFGSVLAWVVVGLMAIGEMLGDPVPLRTLHEPFVRVPALATLFTPGWATGVVFTLLVGALFIGWWTLLSAVVEPGTAAYAPLIVAALLFPIPFTRSMRTPRLRAAVYAVVTVMTLLPLAHLWQINRFHASVTAQVLEWLSIALPLPNILWVSREARAGLGEQLTPLLTTALAWIPILRSLGGELTRVRQRVIACRKAGGTGPAGTAA